MSNYRNHSVSDEFKAKPIIEYINETINGRLPLIGVGDIRNGQDAKEVLATADLAAIGRAILIDPHWAQKVLDDQDHLIRTELSHYDRDELRISNGVWGFLEGMMPERLK